MANSPKVQNAAADITSILENRTLKVKEKTVQLSQLILDEKMPLDRVITIAANENDINKATLIEAMEYASKTKPAVINSNAFKFLIESLKDDAPRVKWESARVIGNAAHLHTGLLKKAVTNLLANTEHKGTVVRWSAAGALYKIIQCKTAINKQLIPSIEAILQSEEDNAIRKIYEKALKSVRK